MRSIREGVVAVVAALSSVAVVHGADPIPSAAAMLALPESQPASAGPPKRALLVGISRYSRGRSGGLDWSDLPTQDDVTIMREVLLRKFGFREADIRVLIDDDATKANIERAFQDHLIGPARPGDVVVFYFSGHGQLVPDPAAWGGARPALVTSNYLNQDARNGFLTHLRSDQLRELLRQLKAKMTTAPGGVLGNITVILDSCHSGGGTKNEMKAKGRAWDDAIDGPRPKPGEGVKPKGAGGYLDVDQAIAEGYTFISACRSDQPALCPAPGTRVSLLTFHLAEGMAKSGPDTTYRDLYEPTSVALSQYQFPQLEGDASKRLLAGTALPAEQYWLIQQVADGVVTLPVGFVQGMTKGSRFAVYRTGTSVRKAENKIAEVQVTEVFTTSCRAKLTAPLPAPMTDADLAAARAVEIDHNYSEHNLRVWLDGVALPAGWKEEDDYLVSDGVGSEDYDIVVRRLSPTGTPPPEENDKLPVIVQRRDGTTLATYASETPADRSRIAGLLRERLLGEWRWVFLSRHLKTDSRPGDPLRVEIRVVPLDVETDSTGRPIRIVGTRQDFAENQPLRQFRVDDWVTVEVRNLSTVDSLYLSILDLGPKGSVVPLFPPNTGRPLTEYAPAKLAPGQDWTRIPNFALRFKPPIGKELLKAIATLEPADFRGLLYLPPGVNGKNAADALSPKSRGLGQLLDHARRGKKDVTLSTIGPDWASAEVAFEVVER